MLQHLRASWRGERADLDRLLRRYYVACCRRIWKLLPMDESRRCVETVERHLVGDATDEDLRKAEWHAEGAAVIFKEGFEDLERRNPGPPARFEGARSTPQNGVTFSSPENRSRLHQRHSSMEHIYRTRRFGRGCSFAA
jgi:hypothetical protein